MPITIQKESVLSLNEAIATLPCVDGRRPHLSTIWRWCKRGYRGIRLEYCRIGNRVVTSREALERFTQRLTEADSDGVDK